MNLLKQFKNLFGAISLSGKADVLPENVVFIHEDDAGQIELSPAENYEYLANECKKITEFSQEHFAGNGWSETYVRKSPPIKILDRRIAVTEFSTPFIESGFTVKPLRFSGMPKVEVHEWVLTNEKIEIYYSYEDRFVSSIYFDGYYKENERSLFSALLRELSRNYNLILVDWNLKEIFDSRHETEIERFYNRYK